MGLRLKVLHVNKSGMTLLEIVVAIAIMGLLAAVIVPRIAPSKPKEEREKFIGKLNTLMGFAWQNAMFTGKVHQVLFHLGQKKIMLKRADKKDKYGNMQYVPVKRTYVKPEVIIPDQIDIKNFYVNSLGSKMIDQMSYTDKKGEIHFFIVPEGLSQETIINFFDTKDKVGRKKREFSVVLNPFSAQFEIYEEFKRP